MATADTAMQTEGTPGNGMSKFYTSKITELREVSGLAIVVDSPVLSLTR
jgi:hypothetical protein